jgi:hypothetical protein
MSEPMAGCECRNGIVGTDAKPDVPHSSLTQRHFRAKSVTGPPVRLETTA